MNHTYGCDCDPKTICGRCGTNICLADDRTRLCHCSTAYCTTCECVDNCPMEVPC